jgi:hypothetical protein
LSVIWSASDRTSASSEPPTSCTHQKHKSSQNPVPDYFISIFDFDSILMTILKLKICVLSRAHPTGATLVRTRSQAHVNRLTMVPVDSTSVRLLMTRFRCLLIIDAHALPSRIVGQNRVSRKHSNQRCSVVQGGSHTLQKMDSRDRRHQLKGSVDGQTRQPT